jgi:hypothetical protein
VSLRDELALVLHHSWVTWAEYGVRGWCFAVFGILQLAVFFWSSPEFALFFAVILMPSQDTTSVLPLTPRLRRASVVLQYLVLGAIVVGLASRLGLTPFHGHLLAASCLVLASTLVAAPTSRPDVGLVADLVVLPAAFAALMISDPTNSLLEGGPVVLPVPRWGVVWSAASVMVVSRLLLRGRLLPEVRVDSFAVWGVGLVASLFVTFAFVGSLDPVLPTTRTVAWVLWAGLAFVLIGRLPSQWVDGVLVPVSLDATIGGAHRASVLLVLFGVLAVVTGALAPTEAARVAVLAAVVPMAWVRLRHGAGPTAVQVAEWVLVASVFVLPAPFATVSSVAVGTAELVLWWTFVQPAIVDGRRRRAWLEAA